jgi:hypothetical protein
MCLLSFELLPFHGSPTPDRPTHPCLLGLKGLDLL